MPAYIYDGLKTPFGRHAGAVAPIRPDDLLSGVIYALISMCIGVGQGIAAVLERVTD